MKQKVKRLTHRTAHPPHRIYTQKTKEGCSECRNKKPLMKTYKHYDEVAPYVLKK